MRRTYTFSNNSDLEKQKEQQKEQQKEELEQQQQQEKTEEEEQERDVLDIIFENNDKWVKKMTNEDPLYFTRLTNVHKPQYLFIGCSDARVPSSQLLGLQIGELFVHRNIANQVVANDMNMLAVLSYAVDYLKVKDIFVCGHYECGGIRAAREIKDHGLIEHWLMNIRDLQRIRRGSLLDLEDDNARYKQLVEINVQEQCFNLLVNPIIQKSYKEENRPHIHGLVYNVGDGLLKKIEPNFKKLMKEHRQIYDLYQIHNK